MDDPFLQRCQEVLDSLSMLSAAEAPAEVEIFNAADVRETVSYRQPATYLRLALWPLFGEAHPEELLPPLPAENAGYHELRNAVIGIMKRHKELTQQPALAPAPLPAAADIPVSLPIDGPIISAEHAGAMMSGGIHKSSFPQTVHDPKSHQALTEILKTLQEQGKIGQWSIPDSPSAWARVFNCNLDTLNRDIEEKRLKVDRLSDKRIRIWASHLPIEYLRNQSPKTSENLR